MTHWRTGTLLLVLTALHGCAPGAPAPASPPSPTPSEPTIRTVENPRNHSVSLVLDPIEVESGPGGAALQVGGMYVRSNGRGPDGGAALVLRLQRSSPTPVLIAGVSLVLEADGVRLSVGSPGPGVLHRSRRTEDGWSETLLVPVSADVLDRLGRARSVRMEVAGGPTLAFGEGLRSGLGALAGRLPDSAFPSRRAAWKAAS